jgi:hypothetical protein
METILISLVSMALIIVASVTMAISTLRSSSQIADSWKQMETKSGNISRTDIAAVPPSNYDGGAIEVTVKNDGQTNLSDYDKWDVIVQYESGGVIYLPHNPVYPAGSNQWAIKGIYASGEIPEIFDRNVLNPGEEMVISLILSPELSAGQACRITIATSNGIKSQTQVIRN